MKEFFSVEEAYVELSKGLMDFVKQRPWDVATCECNIFHKMASTKCWATKHGVRDTAGLDWPDTSIDKGGAALFLRDHLLRTTGRRIWGLTFTLYPDGKFNIEYDYTKPEDYEETDDTVEVDLTGLQQADRPDTPTNVFLAQSYQALQQRTDELAGKWGFGTEASWNLDMNAGVLTFTFDDGRVVEKRVQVIGTLDTAKDTFLWGWDHPSVPEPLRRAARRVREYGGTHEIEKFTLRQIDCNEIDAWEFTAAAFVLDAAEGAYRGSAGSALVYMTFGG